MNLPGYSAQYAHEYHQVRRFHPGYSAQTGEIDKRIFYKKALVLPTSEPGIKVPDFIVFLRWFIGRERVVVVVRNESGAFLYWQKSMANQKRLLSTCNEGKEAGG